MEEPYFLEEIGDDGVARVTLTRVHVHNAFNDLMIAELTRSLAGLESDRRVRVVVLAAQGGSFSAGADLTWMKRMAEYGEAENLEDARALAQLMCRLNELSKPTLALSRGRPSAAVSAWSPAATSRLPPSPPPSVCPRCGSG